MIDGLMHCENIRDDHIFRMTDDTGMLQHSKYSLPDPNHGYTTDDNARALIMALMLYKRYGKKKYIDLVYRYSSFLINAQNEKGKFKNFMGYDRRWLEDEGSDDCFGRCLWALGFALSCDFTPKGIRHALLEIFNKAMPHADKLTYLRGKAYSAIGLSFFDNNDSKELVYNIAQSLCRQYDEHKDGEWKWFENIVAYCNNVLPWSLLAAYKVTGEKRFLETAEESLDFLGKITFKDGYFKPVGCNGWLKKGKIQAEFDEQPVEACEAVLTYLEAFELTGKTKYFEKAKICNSWYEGMNSKGIRLIDNETGGCYDGLTEQGVNLNMGAESLVSYIISYLKISEIKSL
ncbi:glycosyltransferase [Acetivibrio straminisolvens]|nr:glycosyltransferase [Acetivibrio straminisolvens]